MTRICVRQRRIYHLLNENVIFGCSKSPQRRRSLAPTKVIKTLCKPCAMTVINTFMKILRRQKWRKWHKRKQIHNSSTNSTNNKHKNHNLCASRKNMKNNKLLSCVAFLSASFPAYIIYLEMWMLKMRRQKKADISVARNNCALFGWWKREREGER